MSAPDIQTRVLERIEKDLKDLREQDLTLCERDLIIKAARLSYSFACFDFLKAGKKSLDQVVSDLFDVAFGGSKS